MIIRAYEETDFARMAEMYEREKPKEEMFDMNAAIVGKVVCDEDKPIMAAFLSPVIEAHLFMDGNWRSPAWRWATLGTLHQEMMAEAAAKKVERAHALIDPVLERTYGKRLAGLGWQRKDWKYYVRTP